MANGDTTARGVENELARSSRHYRLLFVFSSNNLAGYAMKEKASFSLEKMWEDFEKNVCFSSECWETHIWCKDSYLKREAKKWIAKNCLEMIAEIEAVNMNAEFPRSEVGRLLLTLRKQFDAEAAK